MRDYLINRPIGLDELCLEVEEVCKNPLRYGRCGVKPRHLIIPMDTGTGRTTFVEYLTSMYKSHKILDFLSGPDDYIEVTFDGSLLQMRKAFSMIDSMAVYTNEYSNVVSMDISNVAPHLNETQCVEFINGCKKLGEAAYMVLFIHSIPNRNEERLVSKIQETLPIKLMSPVKYSTEDICQLIEREIASHGVVIGHYQMFHSVLLAVASEYEIVGVKQAIRTSESIISYADFTCFTPVVDEKSISSMLVQWRNNKERAV